METQYKKLIVFIPAINCCFIHLMIYSISWVIAVGEKTRTYSFSIACNNLCMGDSETVITDSYELWSRKTFFLIQNDLKVWYDTIIDHNNKSVLIFRIKLSFIWVTLFWVTIFIMCTVIENIKKVRKRYILFLLSVKVLWIIQNH